jgi:hypothetical protein
MTTTLLRRIALLVTGLTVLLVAAGPAHAATSNVKLRNLAAGTKLLTRDASGLTSMKNPGAANQIWTKTDTSNGYATYSQGNLCLTGRGLQGLPLVTAERCVPGATKQQWRLGVSKDLQLRLNGLAAEVNTASAALQVRMALFTVKPQQRWTVLAA